MSEVAAEQSIEDRISAAIAPEEPEAVVDTPADEVPDEQTAADSGGEGAAPDVPADEPEGIELSSVAELAEHLGIEADDLYNLSIPVKDGENSTPISLGELKDVYQDSRQATKQAAEVKAAKEAFEAESAQARQKIEHDIAAAAKMMDTAAKSLMQEFESIDWNSLNEEDPARWAATRQQFAEKQAEIQRIQQEVAVAAQQHQASIESQMQEQHAKVLEAERAALLEAIPEWKDAEKGKAGMAELTDYLKSTGWSEEEIGAASDHRALVIARKAMLYDRNVAKANAEQKRVVRIGKRKLKPGAKADPAETQRESLQADMAKFRKDGGNVRDAAALISRLI